MAIKLYQLYCEVCNWKHITHGDDVDSFYEYKTSPIQKNIPRLEKGEVVESTFHNRAKKIRCPSCGRMAKTTTIEDSQGKLNEKKDMTQRVKERIESELKHRLQEKEHEKNRASGNKEGDTQ